MNSEQFLNWIISNPEYAGFAMFLIAFLEAFFISGAIWPSVIPVSYTHLRAHET